MIFVVLRLPQVLRELKLPSVTVQRVLTERRSGLRVIKVKLGMCQLATNPQHLSVRICALSENLSTTTLYSLGIEILSVEIEPINILLYIAGTLLEVIFQLL